MASAYDDLLRNARTGDRDTVVALRREARRRGDPHGLLVANLFDQPSDDHWNAVYAAIQEGGAGGDLSWVEAALDERWPDAMRTLPVELPDIPLVEYLTTRPSDWMMFRVARGVDLSHEKLTNEELSALAASRNLQRIRVLRLQGCGVGPDGAAALASSELLSRLHTLDLADNPLGDDGIAFLSRARRASELQTLVLTSTHLRAAGVRALANATFAPQLIALHVSYNDLNVEGAQALAEGQLSALLKMGVAGANLGAEGIARLAQSPQLLTLEVLDLRDNYGGVEGATALARSKLDRLRELRLGDEFGGDTSEGTFQALAGSASMRNLRVLDLANHVGLPAGMRALAESPYITQLQWLDLTSAWIGDEGAQIAASSKNFANLTHLSLMTNDLHDPGLVALAASPVLTRLRSLSLDMNDFTRVGVQALLASTTLANLVDLSISINDPEAARLAVFATALPLATRLAIFRSQPLENRRIWAREAGIADADRLDPFELEVWIETAPENAT